MPMCMQLKSVLILCRSVSKSLNVAARSKVRDRGSKTENATAPNSRSDKDMFRDVRQMLSLNTVSESEFLSALSRILVWRL